MEFNQPFVMPRFQTRYGTGVGDEPYYVTMPSLIGKTALQAHDELKQLGLTMIADPADPFGYVIGQSIYAGTQVEFGSSVTVYFGYSTTGG